MRINSSAWSPGVFVEHWDARLEAMDDKTIIVGISQHICSKLYNLQLRAALPFAWGYFISSLKSPA